MSTNKQLYEEELKQLNNEKISSKQQAYVISEQAKMYANNANQKNGLVENGTSNSQNVAYNNALMNNYNQADNTYNSNANALKTNYRSALEEELETKMMNGTEGNYQSYLKEILDNNNLDLATQQALTDKVNQSYQTSDVNSTITELQALKNNSKSDEMRGYYNDAIADLLSNKESYGYQYQVDKLLTDLQEKETLVANKAEGSTSGTIDTKKATITDFGTFKGTGNKSTQDEWVQTLINLEAYLPEGLDIDFNVGKGSATYTIKNGKWVFVGKDKATYGQSNRTKLYSAIASASGRSVEEIEALGKYGRNFN